MELSSELGMHMTTEVCAALVQLGIIGMPSPGGAASVEPGLPSLRSTKLALVFGTASRMESSTIVATRFYALLACACKQAFVEDVLWHSMGDHLTCG